MLIIVAGLSTISLIIILLVKLTTCKRPSLEKRHVVITGGSSGIGKGVAIEVAKRGADVTIIARDVGKLETAKAEIQKACLLPDEQNIRCLSMDLVDNYEAIEKAMKEIEDNFGPIYMLVNCAGLAICGKLEDMTAKDIKYLLDVNYLGSVYPTKAVISRMKGRREGKIIFVSSQAALLGIFGFSCYSASKFALRGLAEALHMEVKPYNISVTLSLPQDTDTPGFENEQKSKPIETRLICESGGLFPPEKVAKQMIEDSLDGMFYSTVGFESWITRTLCTGMMPLTTLGELICQVSLMGILRLVSVFYLISFQRIISKCMKSRDQTKKSE